MSTEVSKELKGLSKTWQKTEAKQGGGGNKLEDGEYVFKILSMEVGKSKKGRLQVAIKYKIRKPKESKGKETMTFHGLENENNIAYFKGLAEVIGLELPDDMEDLPEALEAFVEENEDDLTVKMTTSAKGYQNMTILAVGDEAVETASDDADEDDDSSSDDDDEDESDKKKSKKSKKSKKDEDEDEDEDDADADKENEDEDEEEDKKKKKKKKSRK